MPFLVLRVNTQRKASRWCKIKSKCSSTFLQLSLSPAAAAGASLYRVYQGLSAADGPSSLCRSHQGIVLVKHPRQRELLSFRTAPVIEAAPHSGAELVWNEAEMPSGSWEGPVASVLSLWFFLAAQSSQQGLCDFAGTALTDVSAVQGRETLSCIYLQSVTVHPFERLGWENFPWAICSW